MHAANFDLAHYKSRIGYSGVARPDIATVSEWMHRQLCTVPFENLDVQAHKCVSLKPEDIVDKILHKGGGGYCYEVNGLFAMALEALGVPYFFVAARPMFYSERRPKTHMAIVAHLNGSDWLCDLGFGSYGLRFPFPLTQTETKVWQDDDVFKLSVLPNGELLLQAISDGQWTNQYSFDLNPWEWVDFAPANHLNSTHPEAIFVKQLLVILQTKNGRKILSGNTFKMIEGTRSEKRSMTPQAIDSLLSSEFGIPAERIAQCLHASVYSDLCDRA